MGSRAVLDELAELADRRHRDPAAVLARATELVEGADAPSVSAAASWVVGLALHELGRHREALGRYRAAVATSVAHNLPDREAMARASMAISLLSVGDVAGSTREIGRAREMAPTSVRGEVELLGGVVLHWTGHLDQALPAYGRSLRSLARTGSKASIARLRVCRGILHGAQGHLDAALADFAEGERIALERDLPMIVAMAAHNTGFAYCRQGRLPEALAAFDRAQRAYQDLDNPDRLVAVLDADRSEVLLAAGLVGEARAAAASAVAALARGDLTHLNECRLLLARSLLAAGAYDQAAAEAALAARQFRAARRLPWSAQARYVEIQAAVLAHQDQEVPPPGLLRRSRRIAAELESQGWAVEALHVRTFVGRMALALGRPAVARTELGQSASARTVGSADCRAQAWHATALLRLAEGDRAGAKRALGRGITVVDEYRATLGGSELRARAAGHSADLARLGVRLALDGGRPAEVLRWVERGRAGALRRPPARPPDDGELAADLAQLRRIRTELRDAALNGGPTPTLTLQAAAVEERVRDRTRRASDDGAADTGRLDVASLRRALGDRVLVEFVSVQGRLHAVTVRRAGVKVHDLAPAVEVERERQYLMFALRRLLWPGSRAVAESALASTAARLDELLLAPLGVPNGQPVVVVPTGELHGLPWSTLPTLAGRPTTVAPSAAVWLAGTAGPARPAPSRGRRRVALVAGPRLPGAETEVGQLAALYPRATVLTGERATVAGVVAALEKADLAHLAAHGTFRADSPLFSSVLLHDGPLTVYDLERLRRAPSVVVLSACDAAVAAVHEGDDLLGTAAALLSLGVRAVIAPLLPVPDVATTAVMVALHRRLRAGERPALALAGAGDGQDRAAAAAFVCIGRNDV